MAINEIELSINQFVKCIRGILGENTVIVQFGSSVYDLNKKNLDIDIMLLSEQETFFTDYNEMLFRFKRNLLNGELDCAFKPNMNLISVRKIEAVIKSMSSPMNEYVPEICFGPYKTTDSSDDKNKIYFHIKGLINKEQFLLFCKLFPLHSKALLYNNIILNGRFDVDYFRSYLSINHNEMVIWCKSLKKRLRTCGESISAYKCFKKLCLITCLSHNITNAEEKNLINNINSLFKTICLPNISSESSVEVIKQAFNKLLTVAINEPL